MQFIENSEFWRKYSKFNTDLIPENGLDRSQISKIRQQYFRCIEFFSDFGYIIWKTVFIPLKIDFIHLLFHNAKILHIIRDKRDGVIQWQA